MGNQLGISGTSSVTPRGNQLNLSSDELLAYQDACVKDQDVRKFDSELQARTTRAMTAMIAEVHKPNSFSLDLLKEITGSMVETDQQVVGIILASKKDVWKNQELFSLVDDYYKTSLHTLEFCNNLEKFLTNAKHKQVILQAAIRRLAENPAGEEGGYKKVIEDLKWFRSAESHLSEELLKSFEIVYSEHLQMLQRLQAQRIQLDKKMKKLKSWRKTMTVIFAATVVTVLVCSIAATAIAAPPLVTAVVAAVGAAAAWIPTENWFKRLWKGYEKALQEQREVVSGMQAGTQIAIRDLDNIRDLVERLETEMMDFLKNIDQSIGLEKGSELHLVIKDIENKVDVFTSNVDELGEYVDAYSRNVRQARAVVQQRIIRPSARETETQAAA
ncbi:hypothetical protein ACHQM5_015721 [Ranunculus cassubicifolius]